MSDTISRFADWEGVLGPQSDDEPMFYELRIEDERVRLVGPAPGQSYEYELDEFETLVDEGEWILANDDWENEAYVTTEGQRPY